MLSTPSQQVDIFSDDQHQLRFAELCNALYERELAALSQQKINNVSLLQRKLGGLKHHVKRAADSFLQNTSPLEIDIHNASWQAKQSNKCPAKKFDSNKTEQWFSQPIRIGSCVPIHVAYLGMEHIELDSIDRIDSELKTVHANKFGWFHFAGESAQNNRHMAANDISNHDIQSLKLLKPNKAIVSAACCGHSWNHKGKSSQRALTLRELLLSLSIDWKTFR